MFLSSVRFNDKVDTIHYDESPTGQINSPQSRGEKDTPDARLATAELEGIKIEMLKEPKSPKEKQ